MTAFPAAGMAASSRHNLPAEVASFIGREREIGEIKHLLSRTRLLTLTGAGGCGKTRLALRVASDLVNEGTGNRGQGNRASPSLPQTWVREGRGERGPAPTQSSVLSPESFEGVWLVQFAPLTDSALVPRAVAAALGVRGGPGRPLLATLAAALAPRRLLLVLDNCEHLIGACARLAETLLRACPHLRILATSREPLRIPGEVTWRVPSLTLPDSGPLDSLESLARVAAMALFLDRARARAPGFALTLDNAPAVAAICRQLDGLPLGIELAAAQMGVLAPEQIATRLDDSLRVLGKGNRTLARQETLRATLDWSHALLDPAERLVFRRLAVFAGGIDVEAAERVCGGEGLEPPDLLALLTALVEKSLVEPQIRAGQARYRLLEPVRQYAWAELTAHAEAEGLQRRHAQYFLGLAETAEPGLMSGKRGPWLARLATEQDNLRAALAWSRRGAATASDRELSLRLVGALAWFWVIRGEVSEGLDWTEAALASGQEAAPAVRAKALDVAGELTWLRGQNALAQIRLQESAALWRELGDKRGLAYVLQALPMVIDEPAASVAAAEALRLFEEVGDTWGAAHAAFTQSFLALVQGGRADAEQLMEAALTRFRRLGDQWGVAQALNYLGDFARGEGDDARASARYAESLELLRKQGLPGTVPSLLHNLGYLALRGGKTRRALRLFGETLVLFRNQGDHRGIADCLDGLAGVLGALKQPERAARLFGAAEVFREATGAAVWPANAPEIARSLAVARGQVDEAVFSAAWAAGRMLTLEQATGEALAAGPPGPALAGPDMPELTPREGEVAALVARGLTNRQIGAALVITEGTARLHVKHILQKLGFSSRSQVAVWAVDRGLAAAPGTRQDLP